MPIKWSAVEVMRAMDEVERQIALAEGFISEAKAKAERARGIPNLPQYLDGRIVRLISDIERVDRVKDSIEAVHNAVPDNAVEDEQKRTRYGQQQGLV